MTEFQFSKRIILREYPGAMIILVLNELLGACLVVFGIGVLISFISGLLGGDAVMPGPIEDVFQRFGVRQWPPFQSLALIALLMFLRILLDAIRSYVAGHIGAHMLRAIRKGMNAAIADSEWQRFLGTDHGDYMQCMIAESSLARGAVQDLAAAFGQGLLLLLLLGFLGFHSPGTVSFVVALGAVFLLTNLRLLRSLRQISEDRIASMAWINTRLADIRHAFKLLFAEGLARAMATVVDVQIDRVTSLERRELAFSIVVQQYIILFGIVAIVAIAGMRLSVFPDGGASLLFDLLLIQRISTHLGEFQVKRKNMVLKIPSYEACLKMIEAVATAPPGRVDSGGRYVFSGLGTGLELKKVSFAYGSEPARLKNINICLPPTGLVYFLGPSGSGKTTLIDIVLGLLKPAPGGQVLVDGRSLDELERKSWTQRVAYVPQDTYMFTGTLRNYLTFGAGDVNDTGIWEALRRVDMENFVLGLPHNLDAPVLHGGASYSGGERHRLAIARALVRDADVIVLDEPSAALDASSEKLIFRTLRAQAAHKLIIVITHSRAAHLGTGDCMYQLSDGACVWSGSYAQLLECEGVTAAAADG